MPGFADPDLAPDYWPTSLHQTVRLEGEPVPPGNGSSGPSQFLHVAHGTPVYTWTLYHYPDEGYWTVTLGQADVSWACREADFHLSGASTLTLAAATEGGYNEGVDTSGYPSSLVVERILPDERFVFVTDEGAIIHGGDGVIPAHDAPAGIGGVPTGPGMDDDT